MLKDIKNASQCFNNSVSIRNTSNSRHFSSLVVIASTDSVPKGKSVIVAMAAVIAQMTRNNRLRKAKKVKTNELLPSSVQLELIVGLS